MDQAEVLYACRLWELLEEKEAVECIDFSKLSRRIIRQEIQPLVRSQLAEVTKGKAELQKTEVEPVAGIRCWAVPVVFRL